jgi:hypothetical protein
MRLRAQNILQHANPGKPIFSFSGNEFYYKNAFKLLVRRICVVIFIAGK